MLRATFRFILRKPRLCGFIFMVLATPVLWAGWVVSLDSRVQRLHAQLRKEGYPAINSNLNRSPIPDEINAWRLQHEAGKIVENSKVTSPSNQNYVDTPVGEQWIKQAEASEKAHEKAFELAHEARKYSQSRFDIHYTDPPDLKDNSLGIQLTLAKDLTNTLRDSAQYHAQKGEISVAISRGIDTIHLAKTVGNEQSVISALVAMGINASSYETLAIVAPKITADDRETIANLIPDLLDETARNQSAIVGNRADRLMSVAYANEDCRRTWFTPLCDVNDLYSIGRMKLAESALTSPDWQSILNRLEKLHFDYPPYVFTLRYIEGSPYWIERHYRCLAESRMLAANLACQLYRIDHGKYPETLDELVPQYLPAIPTDPFTLTPIKLTYFPHKYKTPDGLADRPVLAYQYGRDLGPNVYRPIYDWEIARRSAVTQALIQDFWQYRDLTDFPALPDPEQTLYNQPNKPDEAGDQENPENASPDQTP